MIDDNSGAVKTGGWTLFQYPIAGNELNGINLLTKSMSDHNAKNRIPLHSSNPFLGFKDLILANHWSIRYLPIEVSNGELT